MDLVLSPSTIFVTEPVAGNPDCASVACHAKAPSIHDGCGARCSLAGIRYRWWWRRQLWICALDSQTSRWCFHFSPTRTPHLCKGGGMACSSTFQQARVFSMLRQSKQSLCCFYNSALSRTTLLRAYTGVSASLVSQRSQDHGYVVSGDDTQIDLAGFVEIFGLLQFVMTYLEEKPTSNSANWKPPPQQHWFFDQRRGTTLPKRRNKTGAIQSSILGSDRSRSESAKNRLSMHASVDEGTGAKAFSHGMRPEGRGRSRRRGRRHHRGTPRQNSGIVHHTQTAVSIFGSKFNQEAGDVLILAGARIYAAGKGLTLLIHIESI